MKKIEVKVRYLFEGTYTVAADDRNEARTMVTRDCGLVLGGNIHTTLDDDEVDWEFDVHPDMQILSYTELEQKEKPKRLKMDFSDSIETLRRDIIDAIRQLLYSHGLTEITFPEEQYDPVWVIWFNWDGDPYECKVMGIKVTDNSMTVIAHDKIADNEVVPHRLNSEQRILTGYTRYMMPYGSSWKRTKIITLKDYDYAIRTSKCSIELPLLYVECLERGRVQDYFWRCL